MPRSDRAPRPQPNNGQSKQICTVLGVVALGYCMYGFLQTLRQQTIHELDEQAEMGHMEQEMNAEHLALLDEMEQVEYDYICAKQEEEKRRAQRAKEKQEELRLKREQDKKQQQQQYNQNNNNYNNNNNNPRDLRVNTNMREDRMYHTQGNINNQYTSASTTDDRDMDFYVPPLDPFDSSMERCVGADESSGHATPTSKTSGSGGRWSTGSQPASPTTRNVLQRLQKYADVQGLWDRVAAGQDRVDKEVMLQKLLQVVQLEQEHTQQSKTVVLEKVVTKLAKGGQFITKARWDAQLTANGSLDLVRIVDDVD